MGLGVWNAKTRKYVDFENKGNENSGRYPRGSGAHPRGGKGAGKSTSKKYLEGEKLPKGNGKDAQGVPRAKIDEFKEQFNTATVEHVRVLDPDGKIVREVGGDATSVRNVFPDGERTDDCDVIHNHPYADGVVCPALSPADCASAVTYNLASITATTPGKDWTLVRPEQGWGKLMGLRPGRAYKQNNRDILETAWTVAEAELVNDKETRDMVAKFSRGKLTAGETNAWFTERVSARALAEFGLKPVVTTK